MLYDYFNKISNENKFNYLAISIIIFFLLINVIQITPTLFIGLILSAILFYFLNDKDQSNITDFNKDLEFKLSKGEKYNHSQFEPRRGGGENPKLGVRKWEGSL